MLQPPGHAGYDPRLQQRKMHSQIRIAVNDLGHHAARAQLHAQLLPKLPFDGLLLRFSRFHLAARELPLAAPRLVHGTAADQKAILPAHQRRHNLQHGLIPPDTGNIVNAARAFVKRGGRNCVHAGEYDSINENANESGGKTMFKDKIAVITGGASGIGRCIAEQFRANGAKVEVIDIKPGAHFVGDVGDPAALEAFAVHVIAEHGHVDYLINNALPAMKGIDDCSWEEFNEALRVGVSAPFYLTRLLLPHFAPGAAIVNISSSRDRMSQPQTESYTAAKGGVSALTHALAVSLAGRVRVNSISPGWIDTVDAHITGPDAIQQPVGRVGRSEDIANMVLFLCSDKAGFITGENICIDGGMTRQMIYHNDFGWKLEG